MPTPTLAEAKRKRRTRMATTMPEADRSASSNKIINIHILLCNHKYL